MSGRPSFGPIAREEMQRAADSPFGKAADIIRRHDPAFGTSSDAAQNNVFVHKITKA